MLSHYDAVIWYTGDDVVTREPGWGPGNASRLAMQEIHEMRDFMNEGGRVLYTGQRAGQQYTTALGSQLYDPFENQQCSADPAVASRCLPLQRLRRRTGRPDRVLVRRGDHAHPAEDSIRKPATRSRSPAWTTRWPG